MEKWKKVTGYEDEYKVSSYGRVTSVNRLVNDGRTEGHRVRKGKLLSLKGGGYYARVILHKDGIKTGFSVHRLVAVAFIENKNLSKVVNHIDFNKRNNNIENLEWCTHAENYKHSLDAGRIKPYWTGKKRSEETKRLIGEANKGRVSSRKGIKLSTETKNKISSSLKKWYKHEHN